MIVVIRPVLFDQSLVCTILAASKNKTVPSGDIHIVLHCQIGVSMVKRSVLNVKSKERCDITLWAEFYHISPFMGLVKGYLILMTQVYERIADYLLYRTGSWFVLMVGQYEERQRAELRVLQGRMELRPGHFQVFVR